MSESNRAKLMAFICTHASSFAVADFVLSANTLNEEEAGKVLEVCQKLEASWALKEKRDD